MTGLALRQVFDEKNTSSIGMLIAALACFGAPWRAYGEPAERMAAKSPWGPDDEIGALNGMTDTTRLAILQQIASALIISGVP